MKLKINLFVILAIALSATAPAQEKCNRGHDNCAFVHDTEETGSGNAGLKIRCRNGTDNCATAGDHQCGGAVRDPDQGQGGGTVVTDPDQGQGGSTTKPPAERGEEDDDTKPQGGVPASMQKEKDDLDRQYEQAKGQQKYYQTIVKNNVQYRTDPKFKNVVDGALKQVNHRIDLLVPRIKTLEDQMKSLTAAVVNVKKRMDSAEGTLGNHGGRLDTIEKHLGLNGTPAEEPADDGTSEEPAGNSDQQETSQFPWDLIIFGLLGLAAAAFLIWLVVLLFKGRATSPKLTIKSVTPDSGPEAGGTLVTIKGSGVPFTATMAVAIGGTPVVITGQTTDELVVTTPAGAVGKVDIWIGEPGTVGYTFKDAFEYTP